MRSAKVLAAFTMIGFNTLLPIAANAQASVQPPLPTTISAEARAALQAPFAAAPTSPQPTSISQIRAAVDAEQQRLGKRQLLKYGVTMSRVTWGGLPALQFDPPRRRADRQRSLLMNFHGGGFVVDSGSMTENIKLAALSGTRVISILYRLAPEHPFPAAVDDALTAYREALRFYRPEDVVVYGTSAGAILAAELIVRLKHERLPLPAAVGNFSLTADITRTGDSESFLPPLAGSTVGINQILASYVGKAQPSDPLVSPLFSDLHGSPPTLVMASTRDQLLSQSAIYHRALLRASVAADLVVFEGLPHAFWSSMECPETDEAFEVMNSFFDRHLKAGHSTTARKPHQAPES